MPECRNIRSRPICGGLRASRSAWSCFTAAPIAIPPSRPGRQSGRIIQQALPMRLMESHAAWEAAEQSASSTRRSLRWHTPLEIGTRSLRISSWPSRWRSSTGAIRWYAKRRRPDGTEVPEGVSFSKSIRAAAKQLDRNRQPGKIIAKRSRNDLDSHRSVTVQSRRALSLVK